MLHGDIRNAPRHSRRKEGPEAYLAPQDLIDHYKELVIKQGATQEGSNFLLLDENTYCHHEELPSKVSDEHIAWYRHGVLHRDDDKPASIYAAGTMMWYSNGKLHREGGKPALITPGVRHEFHEHGKKIRVVDLY